MQSVAPWGTWRKCGAGSPRGLRPLQAAGLLGCAPRSVGNWSHPAQPRGRSLCLQHNPVLPSVRLGVTCDPGPSRPLGLFLLARVGLGPGQGNPLGSSLLCHSPHLEHCFPHPIALAWVRVTGLDGPLSPASLPPVYNAHLGSYPCMASHPQTQQYCACSGCKVVAEGHGVGTLTAGAEDSVPLLSSCDLGWLRNPLLPLLWICPVNKMGQMITFPS